MRAKDITSERNATFRMFLALGRAGGIRKHRAAILSGPKQVKDVMKTFPDKCAGILFSDGRSSGLNVFPEQLPLYRLSRPLFRQIDRFETGPPLLLIRAEPLPAWEGRALPPGCTLCIPFQDPANVGALIRTAAAFGVSAVVLLKEACHPFLPKVLRASGGNIFNVPLFNGPALDELAVPDAPLIGLSAEGTNIHAYEFPAKFCLVPGLEGRGLPGHLKQAVTLSIPMVENVESLNAALATGVALYEWRRGKQNPVGHWREKSNPITE